MSSIVGASSLGAQVKASDASGGDVLNLGFERPSPTGSGAPAGWYVGGSGYEIVLDTVSPRVGTRSLRIEAFGPPRFRTFGVGTASVPARPAVGRTVRLKGYIRTDAIDSGYAGLWLRLDADSGMLALENMSSRGAKGTTPWTAYEIALPVPANARRIAFGVLHPGDGTAWFDALELGVDGEPQATFVEPPLRLTTAQQEWLRRNAIPLAGVDAGAPASDLAPLDSVFDGTRIVALGEATHGTSEFFRMKHRLVEHLATARGFTVFAIEDNLPEARRINDYVLTGRGDPSALVAGMMNWPWKTQEVVELVRWMREYNASGRGRMEFWGFDLQSPDIAMDSVRAFVERADDALLPMIDSNYRTVRDIAYARRTRAVDAETLRDWLDAGSRVLAKLEARASAYTAAGRDTTEVAWALQYARIVAQGGEVATRFAARASSSPRDRMMMENVRWMLQHQPPGTKAVVWAHNGHVARNARAMGGFLDAMYGSAFRTVGFATGEGTVTVASRRGFESFPLEAPPASSVESGLRTVGLPRFALDLRRASREPDGAWLTEPHDFRAIGSMLMDDNFAERAVARDFDLLIYLDRTSASRLLPVPARRTP